MVLSLRPVIGLMIDLVWSNFMQNLQDCLWHLFLEMLECLLLEPLVMFGLVLVGSTTLAPTRMSLMFF